jgi:hypothetical protein
VLGAVVSDALVNVVNTRLFVHLEHVLGDFEHEQRVRQHLAELAWRHVLHARPVHRLLQELPMHHGCQHLNVV